MQMIEMDEDHVLMELIVQLRLRVILEIWYSEQDIGDNIMFEVLPG